MNCNFHPSLLSTMESSLPRLLDFLMFALSFHASNFYFFNVKLVSGTDGERRDGRRHELRSMTRNFLSDTNRGMNAEWENNRLEAENSRKEIQKDERCDMSKTNPFWFRRWTTEDNNGKNVLFATFFMAFRLSSETVVPTKKDQNLISRRNLSSLNWFYMIPFCSLPSFTEREPRMQYTKVNNHNIVNRNLIFRKLFT